MLPISGECTVDKARLNSGCSRSQIALKNLVSPMNNVASGVFWRRSVLRAAYCNSVRRRWMRCERQLTTPMQTLDQLATVTLVNKPPLTENVDNLIVAFRTARFARKWQTVNRQRNKCATYSIIQRYPCRDSRKWQRVCVGLDWSMERHGRTTGRR